MVGRTQCPELFTCRGWPSCRSLELCPLVAPESYDRAFESVRRSKIRQDYDSGVSSPLVLEGSKW